MIESEIPLEKNFLTTRNYIVDNKSGSSGGLFDEFMHSFKSANFPTCGVISAVRKD